jgi:transposase-like protein
MNQERNSYLEKNYYSKVNVRVPRYIKVKFRPQILLKSYKKLLSSGYSESKNRFYIL